MRGPSIRVIALTAALCVVGAPLPALAVVGRRAPSSAEEPAAGEGDARALYAAGEREYHRGKFREALEKFERAYDLSDQPLLLYNIALAYRRLYEVANDVEELRRGRAVLNNFMMFAARDPDLESADAKKLLVEIEELIAAHEESKPEPAGAVTEPTPPVLPDDKDRKPPGEDPGRGLRIGGGVALGVGGVFIVGGTVAGIVYAIKGQQFADELALKRTEMQAMCIDGMESMPCRMNTSDIDTARDNGKKANLGVGLSFGIGGGLGLIGIATGIVLFIQGNRRSKEWRSSAATERPRVWPTLTRRGMGLAGRF